MLSLWGVVADSVPQEGWQRHQRLRADLLVLLHLPLQKLQALLLAEFASPDTLPSLHR